MLSIEDLYRNEHLDDFIMEQCRKKRIYEFDDFKQNVFLYLLETGEEFTISAVKKIVDKIATREKKKQIYEYAHSFIENIDSEETEATSVLWEDNHIVGIT